MQRAILLLLPATVFFSCLDPLQDKHFACDPNEPDSCGSGQVCVPVESPYYAGVCRSAGPLSDLPDLSDVPGRDVPDVPDAAELPGDPGPDPLTDTEEPPADAHDIGPQDLVGPPDLPLDVVEVGPDACVPDCRGRECGNDGCGGTCGECVIDARCGTASCEEGRCVFQVSKGWCFIDGTCWRPGKSRPGFPCQVCNADDFPLQWTLLPPDTPCQDFGTCDDQGVCQMPCWKDQISPGTPSCPDGFRAYDGCFCRVPPMGTTLCARGAERVPCADLVGGQWFGQDGHFPSGPVQVQQEGGVGWKDLATGVSWNVTAKGKMALETAAALCASIGPSTDWRVPSRWVLLSVMDFSKSGCVQVSGGLPGGPLWPQEFQGTCDPTVVWTSDRPAGVIETPPLVLDGASGVCRKSEPFEWALPWCAMTGHRLPVWDRQRFLKKEDTAAATVFDRLTGLEWEVPPGADVQGDWTGALSLCASKGEGWRLPNVKEFASVMEEGRIGMCPAWSQAFSDFCAQGESWWTSTPVPWEAAEAYVVSDDGVSIAPRAMAKSARVLCVRGGTTPPVSPAQMGR